MTSLNKIYSEMAARGATPQVEVQAIQSLGKNTFKVVAAIHGVSGEDVFADAIATITSGKGRVIPGSFKARANLAVAVVAANAQSKPIDASFTMVTAASAVDPAGTIWRVEADGKGKRVVLESSDDLAGIFNDRMTRRSVHINPVEGRGLATASFSNGDLVRYVDVDTASTRWGIALNSEEGMVAVGPSGCQTLAKNTVISSASRSKLPKELATLVNSLSETAKLSGDKMNKFMDYLKKAYGPASGPMLDQYNKLAGETE